MKRFLAMPIAAMALACAEDGATKLSKGRDTQHERRAHRLLRMRDAFPAINQKTKAR